MMAKTVAEKVRTCREEPRDKRKQAQRVLLALKKAQFPAVFVDMVGAGHNYSRDFEVAGKAAFEALMEQMKGRQEP
jgi:hypothetical protein